MKLLLTKKSINKGFTLIELLVVISIISLLSSVILASMQEARAKARDAKRYVEVRSMINALELYHSNYNKYISSKGSDYFDMCGGCGDSLGMEKCTKQLVEKGYISKIPMDPRMIVNGSNYSVDTSDACYNYSYYSLADRPASEADMFWMCKEPNGTFQHTYFYNYVVVATFETKNDLKLPYLLDQFGNPAWDLNGKKRWCFVSRKPEVNYNENNITYNNLDPQLVSKIAATGINVNFEF